MKRGSVENEKINKYNDGENESIRHEGPLSEGEDRDDYTNEKLIDRDEFAGKWAEKDDCGESSKEPSGAANMDDMDKFSNKAKKDKKEDGLDRNKDLSKK